VAKLHILNDAIRSGQHQRLTAALDGTASSLPWNLRVEPAFGRALDFVVGERLAGWTKASGRAALQLTAAGVDAFEALSKTPDVLVTEQQIIAEFAKAIPETVVARLLGEAQSRT
jgi:hypothetical protein